MAIKGRDNTIFEKEEWMVGADFPVNLWEADKQTEQTQSGQTV